MARGRESGSWEGREIVVALEAQTLGSRRVCDRNCERKPVFSDERVIVVALKAEVGVGEVGASGSLGRASRSGGDPRRLGNKRLKSSRGSRLREVEGEERKPLLVAWPSAAKGVVNGKRKVRTLISSEKSRNRIRVGRKEGACVESPVFIDDGDDESGDVQNDLVIKLRRRITRSMRKIGDGLVGIGGSVDGKKEPPLEKVAAKISDLGLEQGEQSMDLDGNKEECSTPLVKPLKLYCRSALKRKSEVMDDNDKVQNGSESENLENLENHSEKHTVIDSEVNNTLNAKPVRRFTRSSLKPAAEPDVVVVDINGSVQDKNLLTERPLGQSAELNVEVSGTPSLVDGNHSVQNDLPDKPPMRLTRSALKLSNSSTLQGNASEQVEVENGDGQTSDAVRSLKAPRKQKLEMKMSKKISLNKLPSKIKDLLETGLLEGLPVKYILVGDKNSDLRGEIKDSGILCYCASCNGCKVVSPIEFERHSGIKTRNPAHYIHLDNGKSLNDILSACTSAPLDTLEATILLEINSAPVKRSTCLSCEGPLPISQTRMTVLLCSSCTKSRRTSAKAVHTSGSILRDLRLHKLVFEDDVLPDGTELAYYARGKKVLEGYKKGFGIFCHCCKTEISPSSFEAHAGFAARRKPYLHIYTSNGVSLHELSISLSKGRKFSVNDNDDLCSICSEFGDLLLCDGCPRAFHKECVGESRIPRGDWYCSYCQLIFEREKYNMNNENAKAAGRVAGVDSIEQISKRCIRIVQTLETEVGGCSLCRCPGFSKSGFGPRTIIICDQCEREFHVGCLKDQKMASLRELPAGKWFCCASCRRIDTALQNLIHCGQQKLPDSILNAIMKKQEDKCSSSDTDFDVRWMVLKGKIASPDSRFVLSKAVSIFHNRFDPIVDPITGRDFIPSMVYGRSVRGQEFGGMHCAVLTVNSSVVSAGIFRIFGQDLAELPLVATSLDYQGKGYFQMLFSCIERFLGSLKIKTLVLPAAVEAEAIWTDKFGFKKMSDDQMSTYRKDFYQMTGFQGTPLLLKSISPCSPSKRNKEC
ncbi:hypothetical protein Sjap_001327 [Stephania japonica]|uniref:PHD-type domain-containing protein n=1 Tax=Stephania japonica TaxID=461633 RepID=A0AAP0PRK4_9MAGN